MLFRSEVDRVLQFPTNTVIVNLIRAWCPYDWRSRTGDRLYRLEDEGIRNFRWMLEEVRRGGAQLEVEGRLVRRYLVTGPILRSCGRSRSRSRSAAPHTPDGECLSCRGGCLMGAIRAGTTRRASSAGSSLGCGSVCLASEMVEIGRASCRERVF